MRSHEAEAHCQGGHATTSLRLVSTFLTLDGRGHAPAAPPRLARRSTALALDCRARVACRQGALHRRCNAPDAENHHTWHIPWGHPPHFPHPHNSRISRSRTSRRSNAPRPSGHPLSIKYVADAFNKMRLWPRLGKARVPLPVVALMLLPACDCFSLWLGHCTGRSAPALPTARAQGLLRAGGHRSAGDISSEAAKEASRGV